MIDFFDGYFERLLWNSRNDYRHIQPVNGSKAFENAIGEAKRDTIFHGSGNIGQAERIHVPLLDFGSSDGEGGVEGWHRFGELVVDGPHLWVDLTFDEGVHVAQDHRFDAVEDERAQRVDGALLNFVFQCTIHSVNSFDRLVSYRTNRYTIVSTLRDSSELL